MKDSLQGALTKYTKEVYPMHMPGHKAGRLHPLGSLYEIDVTEVEGTDDLHEAEGIIKEAQQRASKVFGAKRTYFLVNGSTVGLMAAMTAVAGLGDTLLVARNCHRSVYDGLVTAGIEPVYVYPKSYYHMIGALDVEEVKAMIKEYPHAKGLIMTNPTYEGIISDIKAIAEVLHENNMVLIVDEAHGAHFAFHDVFPETGLSMGADVVVQSTHKTLPSLTQSAMLHLGNQRVCSDRIEKALALYETSSPSYVMMASLDSCTSLIKEQGERLFSDYIANLRSFYEKATELQHLRILGYEATESMKVRDMGKIIIDLSATDYTGVQIEKILRKQYNIQIEMATPYYVLAMTSIADTKEGIESLLEALLEIDRRYEPDHGQTKGQDIKNKTEEDDITVKMRAEMVMLPRQAYFAKTKKVRVDKSLGAVSGSYVIPYPPGIPLIVPGERINKEAINLVETYKKQGLKVIGGQEVAIIQE